MPTSIRKLLTVGQVLSAGTGIIAIAMISLEYSKRGSGFWGALAAPGVAGPIAVLAAAAAGLALCHGAWRSLVRPIANLQETARLLLSSGASARARPSGVRELRNMADLLNRLAYRLQNLEIVYTDFVANASHELRSPVSNIRITSEVLERRAERLGDDASKLFHVIIAETERLEQVIDELMELSAIESGALVLDEKPFAMRELLEELIGNLQPRIDQKGLTVGVLADPELDVVGDRDRLARAVRNLVDNAIKFTPEGGQIVVSARKASECITIEVTDTGDGIPSGEIPRLFERFYRADKARRREGGTGIGLPIVMSIVEAHGGSVEVHSEEGSGSRFRIKLPIRAVPAGDPQYAV